MKKFTVSHLFTATVDLEVAAEDENKALEKAKQREVPTTDYDYNLENAEVTATNPLPDIGELTTQAVETLLSLHSSGQDAFYPKQPLPVHISYWDGEKLVPEEREVYSIYYESYIDKIFFTTMDGQPDIPIFELPEDEQYDLLLSVIDSNISCSETN